MLRVAAADDAIPALEPLSFPSEVEDGVRDICRRVREEGDAALIELTRRFDGADVAGRLLVTEDEFERAAVDLDPRLASARSEEHTSELQSRGHLVCRLLLAKKK